MAHKGPRSIWGYADWLALELVRFMASIVNPGDIQDCVHFNFTLVPVLAAPPLSRPSAAIQPRNRSPTARQNGID